MYQLFYGALYLPLLMTLEHLIFIISQLLGH